MHTKLAIFATQFAEMTPQEIQASVPVPTYKLGVQYVFEKCIRIHPVDPCQLRASVESDGERHEQQLALAGGSLIAKCSCSSAERPLCRHTVAVLLEYVRQHAQHLLGGASSGVIVPAPEASGAESSRSLNPTLHDVLRFLHWMEQACRSVEQDVGVPKPSSLASGELTAWAHAIGRLQNRLFESDQDRRSLESQLAEHRKQLASVTGELKEREVACEELSRELAAARELQAQIAQERSLLGDQLISFLDETIIKRKVELENLVTSARTLAATLEAMTPVESATAHARAS